LLQETDAEAIGRYRSDRGHRRCVPLSWHRREGTGPRPIRRVEIARARALISLIATQILSISGNVVARRYNVDRSAISRGDPKGKPRPETACSHQNDTKRTRTRNESTLNVPYLPYHTDRGQYLASNP